ncbi:hypothetical protein [Tsukamurella sp. PLM1]|uniref:hypothetical protein n=1 Tax=Tsukamurella sp. PLM1 TaxID=2929795 RepID=UPI00205B8F27|nr:hypothetical protein [Tsukamurella sp. PLM1]BDH59637.1 hypothetical protein MTP03_45760 [Tsukamurella sp. PLM1]
MTTESVIDDAPDRAPGRTDLSNRGRTVIDDRVRRKLIEHAVLSVPGTERAGGLASRQFPAVRFTGASRTEVEVHVAAQWPLDTVRLVPSVRDAVDAELERSLGAAPDDVAVHIARVSEERRGTPIAHLHSAPALASAGTSPTADTTDTTANGARRHVPRRTAGASIAAVPLLLAVLALGVIALRDTAVSFGWIAGSRWLDAVPGVADTRWQWWTWPGAVGAVVVGLALVVTALKPRRHSHTPYSDDLWFRRRVSTDPRSSEEVTR